MKEDDATGAIEDVPVDETEEEKEEEKEEEEEEAKDTFISTALNNIDFISDDSNELEKKDEDGVSSSSDSCSTTILLSSASTNSMHMFVLLKIDQVLQSGICSLLFVVFFFRAHTNGFIICFRVGRAVFEALYVARNNEIYDTK